MIHLVSYMLSITQNVLLLDVMLKCSSVKKTEHVSHQGRPWVLFPLLLSTSGPFSSSHKRGIGFLSTLSTSVQTAGGEDEAGLVPASLGTPSALPSAAWAVGSTPAEPLAGRGGAWWFCCQDVMLHTGLQRLSWSLLIKHFWRRPRWRGSCDSALQRLGISTGLKGAKSKSFTLLSY